MANLDANHPQVRAAAKILWNFLRLDHPLKKCDVIIAMGSHDLRTAEHAAQLALYEWAPLLVCAGGLGRLTRGAWDMPEADRFAKIALEAGVPKERILVENRSGNTGENLLFSRSLLKSRGIRPRSAILVHKPYMERRALATANQVWPELDVVVSSAPVTFENYPTQKIQRDDLIHIMVGDFQRVVVYPRLGYQVAQDIPQNAAQAYEFLLEAGFTDQRLTLAIEK